MIKTELIFHRKKYQIKLVFGFDDAIKAKVQTIVGTSWSQTNKAWIVINVFNKHRSDISFLHVKLIEFVKFISFG